jgi:DNA phosphorothioation-associated putative methyltransferase
MMTEAEAFADGYVTSRGTFQKLFEQHELKTWIDQALDTAAVPAGPGVFYAFRDPAERAAFVASRYRRNIVVPRLTRSVHRFEDYKATLQPLMDFFAARGRLPDVDELPETADVINALGSLKRAFRLIQSATGAEAWAEIAAKRAQDLLIYLALARFDRRPISVNCRLRFSATSRRCSRLRAGVQAGRCPALLGRQDRGSECRVLCRADRQEDT